MPQAVCPWMQGFALLVKFLEVSMSPFLQAFEVPADSNATPSVMSHSFVSSATLLRVLSATSPRSLMKMLNDVF